MKGETRPGPFSLSANIDMGKIEKLRAFLEKEYPDMQIFNCRNNVGDEMETVYRDVRISVDYAVVEKYIEVL